MHAATEEKADLLNQACGRTPQSMRMMLRGSDISVKYCACMLKYLDLLYSSLLIDKLWPTHGYAR